MITGSKIFIRKDHNPIKEQNHKLAPIDTGPYNVTEVDEKASVILIEKNVTERISLDRVVLAPQDHSTIVGGQETNKSRELKVLSHETDEYRGLAVQEETARSPGVITWSMDTKESQSDKPTYTSGPKYDEEVREGAEYTTEKILDRKPQEDGTNMPQRMIRNIHLFIP